MDYGEALVILMLDEEDINLAEAEDGMDMVVHMVDLAVGLL